jgi:hypothetical protein
MPDPRCGWIENLRYHVEVLANQDRRGGGRACERSHHSSRCLRPYGYATFREACDALPGRAHTQAQRQAGRIRSRRLSKAASLNSFTATFFAASVSFASTRPRYSPLERSRMTSHKRSLFLRTTLTLHAPKRNLCWARRQAREPASPLAEPNRSQKSGPKTKLLILWRSRQDSNL